MKQTLLVILSFIGTLGVFSQKIDGQWKGYFDSKGDIVLSGSNTTEFVLELEINGTDVSGFSYSYFQNRKYYVICSLQGTFDKSTKSVEVTETARVKGNTPPDFSDCLQVHSLSYKKDGNTEKLVGKWVTAPGQRGGCGDGKTTLVRRTLSKDFAGYSTAPKSQPLVDTDTKNKKSVSVNKKQPSIPLAKKSPIKLAPKSTVAAGSDKSKSPKANLSTNSTTNNNKGKNDLTKTAPVLVKKMPVTKELPQKIAVDTVAIVPKITSPVISFEKRNSDVLKTIEIENEEFTVKLYDNGEVDGDSVSLFYNGKLVLQKQRLSEKPITITLDATTTHAINELTMYAENLGEIPPNTALMVVMDGEKRYEVRISSDLKNSGTIRFIHKNAAQ